MKALSASWQEPRHSRLHLILTAAGICLVVFGLLSTSSEYSCRTAPTREILEAQPPQPTSTPEPIFDPATPDLVLSEGLTNPVGVIIETNPPPNIIPLILHFSAVLGPNWSIILFTLESTWRLPSSPAFRRAVAHGQVKIRFLPAQTDLSNSDSVSLFLASPWLWQQVETAQRVLLFQADSIICSQSETPVESFFGYDFVGSPIDPKYGQGYNGGLSLRNPRLFLEITQQEKGFKGSGTEFEDQWFYKELKKREDAVLPGVEVASTFAVETIYRDRPLGYHQAQRWQAGNMDKIEEWCPEIKMLVGRRIAKSS